MVLRPTSQASRDLTRPGAKVSHADQLLDFKDADTCAWSNRNGFLEFGIVAPSASVPLHRCPYRRTEDLFEKCIIACDCAGASVWQGNEPSPELQQPTVAAGALLLQQV